MTKILQNRTYIRNLKNKTSKLMKQVANRLIDTKSTLVVDKREGVGEGSTRSLGLADANYYIIHIHNG